jgi:streptogrisin C
VVTTKSGVAPQILAAMVRDLGITQDEAVARIERADWASGVIKKLSAETGTSAWGGGWLAADGTTLKAAVTTEDAANAVKAAGGVPVLVSRSLKTLTSAKTELDLVRADAQGVTGWFVDVTTNKVVMVAKPGQTADAKALAKEAGVPASALSVKVSSATPKPLADVRGADPYFVTLPEGEARCSIGFAVEGGFVTAGHCGAPGTKATDADQQPLGEVEASIFPGDADEGFVKVDGGQQLLPVVNDFQGNELPVGGSTEAPVGATICRSGSTTGTHCGTIEAKNQTVVYPEGAVTGLTQTNACAEGGDSGGPWLVGDQAQGVTSGGSGDCTVGGETFFQPITEILQRNNLTLLTTNGGDNGGGSADPSPAPSASAGDGTGDNGAGGDQAAGACADQNVQAQGAIDEAGTAQAQPRNGEFKARGGQQTACLDAPDGADFDLVLQKQTRNGEFKTVAAATGAGDKTLSFDGRSGTYRYVVVASSGTGTYTLGFSAP